MRAGTSRDRPPQSRLLRGNKDGFEICTVNHAKGGEVRLDATITYRTGDEVGVVRARARGARSGESFKVYTPARTRTAATIDETAALTLNGRRRAMATRSRGGTWPAAACSACTTGWLIEYDPTTLAPLGMVVSQDELHGPQGRGHRLGHQQERASVVGGGRRVRRREAEEQALILYDDETHDVTVVQPNEDGSYWRKIVRNKMIRMKESAPRQGRQEVWMAEMVGEEAAGERALVVGPVHLDHRPGVQEERPRAARRLDQGPLDSTNRGKLVM